MIWSGIRLLYDVNNLAYFLLCIRMNTYIQTYLFNCVYIHTHTCMHIDLNTYIYTHFCTYTYVHTSTMTHTPTYIIVLYTCAHLCFYHTKLLFCKTSIVRSCFLLTTWWAPTFINTWSYACVRRWSCLHLMLVSHVRHVWRSFESWDCRFHDVCTIAR